MLKELKGTEKQVKWANEIREAKMKDFYEWKEKWEGKWEERGNEEELSFIVEITEKIINIELAEKWIAAKNINFSTLLNPKRRSLELRKIDIFDIFK